MPNKKPTITFNDFYVINPEFKYLPNGTAVLTFSLAEKHWSGKPREGYKKTDYSGDGVECTSWHRIACFKDTAEEVNEWLRKGQQITCVVKSNGKAENGYMSPKTFNDRTSYDWIAQSVSLADSEQEPADFVEESEIPF
jgi:hypothetical protein